MVKKSSSNRRHRTKKINDACKVKKNDTVNKKRWTAQSKNEFFKQKRKKRNKEQIVVKNHSTRKKIRKNVKTWKYLIEDDGKNQKEKWRKKRRTKPKTKFIFVVCRRRRIHFTKGIKCLKSKRGDYFLQSLLYNLRTLCANRSIGKPLRKK